MESEKREQEEGGEEKSKQMKKEKYKIWRIERRKHK